MHQEITITLQAPVCTGGLVVFSGVAGVPVAGDVISLRGEKVTPGFWIAPLKTAAAVGKFFLVAAVAADRLYAYCEEKAAGFAVTVTAALHRMGGICRRVCRSWYALCRKVVIQRRMDGLCRAGGLRL